VKRKQLSYCPTMVCYPSSLCGRSLKPLVPADQSFNPQALVLSAKVVNRPNQIHPCFKRFAVTRYCSPSAYKARQALPKRRIESFYKGRVDYSSPLCLLNHSFNLGLAALNDSPRNANYTPLVVLLDCLRDEDSLPHLQARATCLPGRYALAKHLSNRGDVRLQSICAEQGTSAQCRSTAPHPLNHTTYKSPVAAFADDSSQPKASAYHQGQSHPHNAALLFDSKFIHLYLAQISRCGDKQVMDRLAMLTGTILPTRNRSLVETKGSNYCLSRAAKREQNDHPRDKLLRITKAVKYSAYGLGKSFIAQRAFIATLFERVDADVAFINFASGGAVHIRTKYSKWVQVGNPFRFMIKKDYLWTLVLFKSIFSTL
jgi:hypothetical protein